MFGGVVNHSSVILNCRTPGCNTGHRDVYYGGTGHQFLGVQYINITLKSQKVTRKRAMQKTTTTLSSSRVRGFPSQSPYILVRSCWLWVFNVVSTQGDWIIYWFQLNLFPLAIGDVYTPPPPT